MTHQPNSALQEALDKFPSTETHIGSENEIYIWFQIHEDTIKQLLESALQEKGEFQCVVCGAINNEAVTMLAVTPQGDGVPYAWLLLEGSMHEPSTWTVDKDEADLWLHQGARVKPVYANAAPLQDAGALRPLDLSNCLKHAHAAGAFGVDWVDYEPDSHSYPRVVAALNPVSEDAGKEG